MAEDCIAILECRQEEILKGSGAPRVQAHRSVLELAAPWKEATTAVSVPRAPGPPSACALQPANTARAELCVLRGQDRRPCCGCRRPRRAEVHVYRCARYPSR